VTACFDFYLNCSFAYIASTVLSVALPIYLLYVSVSVGFVTLFAGPGIGGGTGCFFAFTPNMSWIEGDFF